MKALKNILEKIGSFLRWIMGKIIRFLQVYQNVFIGALIIVFSVVMLFASTSIRVDKFASSPVDKASFLPRLVFGILIVIGIIMIIQGIQDIKNNRKKALEGEALDKASKEVLRSLGALGMLFLYILCFKPLGFIISSIIFMIAMMIYMTKKEDWKPIVFIIISVAMTLIVYFCFKKFLYIYLPAGILKGVL